MPPIHGLHIEPTNICTLKCAGCARTRFIDQWPQHWKNHNLDITDLDSFLDISLYQVSVNFCGDYGDPIYHPQFIEMVSLVKNRGARVSITTNGSYKNSDWWRSLCERLDANDQIRFSIDGTPDNFTEYRKNAHWPSIEEAIKVCVKKRIRTVWKFIPFDYNQNDIQSARDLAKSLGMEDFLLDPSDRFDSKTEHLIPVQDLIGQRKSAQDAIKHDADHPVDPKCFLGKEHFISSTGHYSPCCFVADHRFYYKTPFGKSKDQYNIRNTKLSEILESHQTREFFKSVLENPPKVCQFNCPRV